MSFHIKDRLDLVDRILEYAIYIYIVFMFLSKGEGIRNILLYGGFGLWLLTIRYRENRFIITRNPVFKVYWIYIASVILSAIFSIDPSYSFRELLSDPLKGTIILCLFSTVLADKLRIERAIWVMFTMLVFTISIGYYSYFAYDLPLMKPDTTLRHAWHNRFAIDLNTLMSFSFALMLHKRNSKALLIFISGVLLWGISALILSSSRAGLVSFFVISLTWVVFSILKKTLLKKYILIIIPVVIIVFVITLLFAPSFVKNRFYRLKNDISTFNSRTSVWKPLMESVKSRPVFGWGYGSRVFKSDIPFQKTKYKRAPVTINESFRNPHNTFLKVLFHQGAFGMFSYVVLIIVFILYLWHPHQIRSDLAGYIIVSSVGILIGTYILQSMVASLSLIDITPILGLGLAAKGLNEDSHS